MEAIAAFGLACNVIQIVDFGITIAEGCREICKNGSTRENARLEEAASRVRSICEDVKAGPKRSYEHASSEDQELGKVASNTTRAADELLLILSDIRPSQPKTGVAAIGWSVKAMQKRRKIETLQRQMESYQNLLETSLLNRLSKKHDALMLQNTRKFASLDNKMQNMIIAMANGHTKLAELVASNGKLTRQIISMESKQVQDVQHLEAEETRAHVTQTVSQLKITQEDSKHRKQVLDSLFFPEIHVRQERIKNAHHKTFEWIFDASDDRLRGNDSFVGWLECGEGVYWMSGKAGSGKSTLMNFIYEDSRTQLPLAVWASNYVLLRPAFFLWTAGSELQKSSSGLLRSLLYQILSRIPDLPPALARDTLQIPAWTEKRLMYALDEIFDFLGEQYRICFFIDGLDEFDEDLQELIDLVTHISKNTNAKLCVSSRPEALLQKAFATTAQLRLEDLTQVDISRYVRERLGHVGIPNLEKILVRKAEGVFLWVTLAVKDILNGFEDGDDGPELMVRLTSLPQEIGTLYAHMLQGIDDRYKDETRLFFELLLFRDTKAKGEITLLDLALATFEALDRCLNTDFGIGDIQKLLSLCKRMSARVRARCRYLVEVVEIPGREIEVDINGEKEFKAAISEILSFGKCKVSFFHRTAQDFLLKDPQGKEVMKADDGGEVEARTLTIKTQLGKWNLEAKLRSRPWTKSQAVNFANEMKVVFRQARKVYDLQTDCLTDVMGLVSRFLDASTALDLRHETNQASAEQAWEMLVNRISGAGDILWDFTKDAMVQAGKLGQASMPFLCLAGLFDYILKSADPILTAGGSAALPNCMFYCVVVLFPSYGLSDRREALLTKLHAFGADVQTHFDTPLGAVTARDLLLTRAALACISTNKRLPDEARTFRLARWCQAFVLPGAHQRYAPEVELHVRHSATGDATYLKVRTTYDLFLRRNADRDTAFMSVAIPAGQLVEMLERATSARLRAHGAADTSAWTVTACQVDRPDLLRRDGKVPERDAGVLMEALKEWIGSDGGSAEELVLCRRIQEVALLGTV